MEMHIGHYIAVYAEAFGHGMQADEVPRFMLDVNEDGTAVITIDGEQSPTGQWTANEAALSITIDEMDMTGDILQDAFKFHDMFGMGLDVVLAKEGTPAANSELYIPENDKKMCGKWKSYRVTDVLGGDAPADVSPDALIMEFSPNYKVTVSYLGQDLGQQKWSLFNDYGSLDDSELNITWDIVEEVIKVTYTNDDFYYVFFCKKATD